MRISCRGPAGITEQWTKESSQVLVGRQLPPGPDTLGLIDEEVSGRHALLSYEGGEYWIEDLGSTNGTWINKKRIKPKTRTRLTPESIIRVGKTTFKVGDEYYPLPGPSGLKPGRPLKELPVESVEAGSSLSDLFLDGASLDLIKIRLSTFCELTSSLGESGAVETLASTLLEHLHLAFPHAGLRRHSGLLLGADLILKAFRPEDESPTCSLTLARHVMEQKKGCLWHIDSTQGIDRSASLIQAEVQSAMYVPLVWKDEVLGVLYMDGASPKAAFGLDDLRLMQAMAIQAAVFIKNLFLQQTVQRDVLVKARLLAQFPRPIAERMARQPSRLSIVSERVDAVTVLFSDVRGFTRLSSRMEPETVVQMLNDMFHDLTPIVLKYNGTVDKYMGDAVLAVFGSPDPDKEQWEHAVRAALEMQQALKRLGSERWKNRTAFQVGIGIHTGPVIHGFIGASERMEYTVIGSTINSASRYCAAAGPGEILISPATYARLHQCIEVEHPPREIDTKHEGKLKAYLVRQWTGGRKADP